MTSEAIALKTKQRPWGITLLLGFVSVVIGGILLWGTLENKKETYLFLVTALGLWWVIQGIIDIVQIFQDHSMWGWKLFMGIVSIIAGSAILMYPVIAAVQLPLIFALIMGIWGLMYGIILLIMAFSGGGWGAGILGVLGIIFGILLIINWNSLGMGLAMLWTGAVFAVIGGIGMIFQAFRQRKA